MLSAIDPDLKVAPRHWLNILSI